MTRTISRWLGLVLGLAGALVALSAQAAQPERIVAVGDLHGDFEAWHQIALKAHIINQRDRWAGGSTILVQTGDIVDRGPDSLKIIRQLMKLQKEAPRSGGRVVVLVGNHEAMNMTDDLRYVDPGEYAAFATPKSARLRERVYQDNREAIVAAYRAKSPTMTSDAIHQAWLAEYPLGKLEHQAAWSPRGELGRWTIANRGSRQDRRHRIRPRRDQRSLCSFPDRRDQSPHGGRTDCRRSARRTRSSRILSGLCGTGAWSLDSPIRLARQPRPSSRPRARLQIIRRSTTSWRRCFDPMMRVGWSSPTRRTSLASTSRMAAG